MQDENENETLLDRPDEFLNNFKIRLDAFAQGAKLVCEHDGKSYNDEDISDLVDKYYQFMLHKKTSSNKINPDQYKHMLVWFKNELALMLEITPKDIQKGEAYWAWQTSNTRKNFESEVIRLTHSNQDFAVKVSESFVALPLTKEQKVELLSIFNEHPPLWFSKRSAWEQKALKNDLQKALNLPEQVNLELEEYLNNSEWDTFTNRSIPATLKWLPIVGASQHILDVGNKSYYTYRVSVPVPYNAHRETQQHLTNLNMAQINEGIPLCHHQQSNRKMVLVSLITGRQTEGWLSYIFLGFYDYVLGRFKPLKEYNAKMVAMEEEALREHSTTINHYNLGVNWFKHVIPARIPQAYIDSLGNTNQFKSAIERHNQLVQESPLFDWENRNPNLFAAALIDASERFADGIFIGHCKSSKDRKGMELLIADAMIVYLNLYNAVPAYNDNGSEREKFINIVVSLFKSGVYSDIAAFHSPGSRGLKDDFILPFDIKDALGESYKNSKKMAGWNKPKLGWLSAITQSLTEPHVQVLMCTIGSGLTLAAILLGGPLGPLCLVGVGLLLTQILATLHQYQVHQLERELAQFNPTIGAHNPLHKK